MITKEELAWFTLSNRSEALLMTSFQAFRFRDLVVLALGALWLAIPCAARGQQATGS